MLEKQRQAEGKVGICNCWESILHAARAARLGHGPDDVVAARAITTNALSGKKKEGEKAIVVYIFQHRRSIMVPEKERKKWGLTPGFAQPGDLVMWGAGGHVALATGSELVWEFERTADKKGQTLINNIDARLPENVVIAAPLPAPGELRSIANSSQGFDLKEFSDEVIVALNADGFFDQYDPRTAPD
jgi:hypothetical protein